jgi:hypothetical protein
MDDANDVSSAAPELDVANEKKLIAEYSELTGGNEAQAKSVCIYFQIIAQSDPNRYHFE